MTTTGLVTQRSAYDFTTTLRRLTDAITAHGATVFATIDHTAGAAGVGLRMPPTTVVIFGNAAVGTPPMLAAPDLAFDLPSRVLVRQRGDTVEVLYADADATAARYRLDTSHRDSLAALSELVAAAIRE